MASLYDNIVKISLRKEIVNIFYAVPQKYYAIKELALDGHWDHCSVVGIAILKEKDMLCQGCEFPAMWHHA